MIVTLNRPGTTNRTDLTANTLSHLKKPSQLLLASCTPIHRPEAGLNGIVDAYAPLFSLLGKLKILHTHRHLEKLQQEFLALITEAEKIAASQYNPEFIVICRYVITATIDDMICHTAWGGDGKWNEFSLLEAFKQDPNHHDKFFAILDRATKEPAAYIDLMELAYLCLSFGYKGLYRTTLHSQYALEQIIDHLYKHIRTYRNNHKPVDSAKPAATESKSKRSIPFIFFVTVCLIMTIFISLGFLMDIIANDAFHNMAQITTAIATENQTG